MKSLDERIKDRIARKKKADNPIDAKFAERVDQSDAPTAGSELAGSGGAKRGKSKD